MTDAILDWRGVVEETVRRRKEEGLTQRHLASLAGVSAPTVIAFERGDTRLRMDKVFAILGALGILADTGEIRGQESFIHAAQRRWVDLTGPLDEDSPARLGDGNVTYDYELQPALHALPQREFLALLKEAGVGETGWPPFWIPTRAQIRPYWQDGQVECWMAADNPNQCDPAKADFWRISPTGQAFLRRGLEEDGLSVLSPGAIFDVSLPVWRTAEVLLHARRLAHLSDQPVEAVRFRLRYAGLTGRELASWAKPHRHYVAPGSWRAKTSDVTSSVTVEFDEISDGLHHVVARLLRPVYARFNGYEPPDELFVAEVAELLDPARRIRGRRS